MINSSTLNQYNLAKTNVTKNEKQTQHKKNIVNNKAQNISFGRTESQFTKKDKNLPYVPDAYGDIVPTSEIQQQPESLNVQEENNRDNLMAHLREAFDNRNLIPTMFNVGGRTVIAFIPRTEINNLNDSDSDNQSYTVDL